jgi:hypothetical protein
MHLLPGLIADTEDPKNAVLIDIKRKEGHDISPVNFLFE